MTNQDRTPQNLLTGFHIIIAGVYAVSFSIAVLSFLSALMTAFVQPLGVPLWFFLIICLAAVATELIITFFFTGPDTGRFLRVRVFIVTGVVSYLLAGLFLPGPLTDFSRFLPSLATLSPPLFSVFVFWLMGSRHNALLDREELLLDMAGKRGEDLLHVLQQDHPRILDGLSRIVSLNRGSIGGIFLLILMTLTLWLGEVQITLPFQISAIISGVFALAGLALGNTYLDDHRTIQRTCLASDEQRVTRVGLALVLIGFSFLIPFFIARNRSLLPLAVLESIFIWIVGIFSSDRSSQTAMEIQHFLTTTSELPQWGQPPMEEVAAQPSEFWTIFIEIIINSLKIGAVLGVIIFLVYPAIQHGGLSHLLRTLGQFFSRSWLGNLFRGVGKILARIWSLLQSIFRFRHRSWARKAGLSSDEFLQSYLTQVRTTEALKGKRNKTLNRLIDLFRRFLDAAISLGVVLTQHMTLREIVGAIPEYAREISTRILQLLERSLYAPEEISQETYSELTQLVRDLESLIAQRQAEQESP
ncbi:DUF4129 domain-containing protein [Spirochaeta lutea]|uniref:DUF4129 domain-containing protein n=1 Tax=Spirochaeta lutea TaxID=1480694 RepID=A0A098QX14_9SPIO|nr:DUF4129 domain-containing protein [Spirochaeta lutea]KGE71943.1 hypothetical protein DC28_09105 [Spirochaeta lutea]